MRHGCIVKGGVLLNKIKAHVMGRRKRRHLPTSLRLATRLCAKWVFLVGHYRPHWGDPANWRGRYGHLPIFKPVMQKNTPFGGVSELKVKLRLSAIGTMTTFWL